MKDVKSYVIGFLTCACLFLIMGQTKSWEDIYAKVSKDRLLEGNWEIKATKSGNKSLHFLYDKTGGRVFQYYDWVSEKDKGLEAFIEIPVLTKDEAKKKFTLD